MIKGFVKDMDNDEYHSNRTHKSSSVLKTALEDANEYHSVYVEGNPPSKKMNEAALLIGNFMHTWLLEPHLLWEEYAVYEGKVKRGQAWEIFQLENEGKKHLSQSQYDLCVSMHDSFIGSTVKIDLKTTLKAKDIFKDGFAEESLFTEIDGLPIKVRFDYRLENGKHIIRDLKTTGETVNTIKDARKVMYDFDYHLSAALYRDALAQELNIDPLEIEFQWVFLSKKDYKLNVFKLKDETYEKGRQKYKDAIKLIKKWEETGDYPVSDIRGL